MTDNQIDPRFYRPVPPIPVPQQPAMEPQEQFADEEEQAPPKEGWGWVGAPDHPDATKHDDGISDLFEVDNDQITDDVDELVDVDFERDILDANENGDIEDLVNVNMEDIMGSAPRPRQPRYRITPRRSARPRYEPPTSAGSMRG